MLAEEVLTATGRTNALEETLAFFILVTDGSRTAPCGMLEVILWPAVRREEKSVGDEEEAFFGSVSDMLTEEVCATDIPTRGEIEPL